MLFNWESLDLNNPKSYSLDHIIPSTKGGSNQLDNLGLIDSQLNRMKHDLTADEFIEICVEVLKNNGYKMER